MATMIEEAFSRICRMKLPVCFDDLLVEIDPNTFRVPMVLDELAESEQKAPSSLCVVLGLEPGSTFRQAVQRYRSGIAPPTPQPLPRGPLICRRPLINKPRKKKRLRLVEAASVSGRAIRFGS